VRTGGGTYNLARPRVHDGSGEEVTGDRGGTNHRGRERDQYIYTYINIRKRKREEESGAKEKEKRKNMHNAYICVYV
jgi:hypothetical protein